MKKTNVSKLTAIILMFAMIFLLNACGAKNDGDTATSQKPDTKTEEPAEQTPEKIEYRELPVIELSDDYASGTFSIDGKVFKLGETAVQDLEQAGFELQYDNAMIEAYSFGSALIKLPENNNNNYIEVTLKPKEAMNIMDEKAIITTLYVGSDDMTNPSMPEVMIGGMKISEFTTLEDVKAKYGGTEEILDVGSGDRLLDVKAPDDSLTFSFKRFAGEKLKLSVSYYLHKK